MHLPIIWIARTIKAVIQQGRPTPGTHPEASDPRMAVMGHACKLQKSGKDPE